MPQQLDTSPSGETGGGDKNRGCPLSEGAARLYERPIWDSENSQVRVRGETTNCGGGVITDHGEKKDKIFEKLREVVVLQELSLRGISLTPPGMVTWLDASHLADILEDVEGNFLLYRYWMGQPGLNHSR